jgi:hypothetical protein
MALQTRYKAASWHHAPVHVVPRRPACCRAAVSARKRGKLPAAVLHRHTRSAASPRCATPHDPTAQSPGAQPQPPPSQQFQPDARRELRRDLDEALARLPGLEGVLPGGDSAVRAAEGG